MLKAIKKFFDETMQVSEQEGADDMPRLHVACAALLLEMARADFEIQNEELAQVADSIQSMFSLSAEDSKKLLELAEQEADDATCHYEFVTLINKDFSKPDKIKLVEMLWQVAYADAHLEKYEEAMVRKISDLLYVKHSDFIAAKHKVLTAMGKST